MKHHERNERHETPKALDFSALENVEYREQLRAEVQVKIETQIMSLLHIYYQYLRYRQANFGREVEKPDHSRQGLELELALKNPLEFIQGLESMTVAGTYDPKPHYRNFVLNHIPEREAFAMVDQAIDNLNQDKPDLNLRKDLLQTIANQLKATATS
jgi:hypothetical protein